MLPLLQTDRDTYEAVSDEDMDLFYFGYACHGLKDVTKFGVIRNYNQEYKAMERARVQKYEAMEKARKCLIM